MREIRIDSNKKVVEVYNGSDILLESHSYIFDSEIDKILFEVNRIKPEVRKR